MPRVVLDRAFSLGIEVLVSEQIIAEALGTLEEVPLATTELDLALPRIWQRCRVVATTSEVHVCDDPKDNCVLACGLDGGATLIITGDRDLLRLESFNGIAIITPREFLQLFQP